jgi:hypothetical protein
MSKTHIGEDILFEKRMKLVVEVIGNIKRKRPIQNTRLDKFSWWIYVEKEIQDELLKIFERLQDESW